MGEIYKPYEERTPDYQYQNVLRHVRDNGVYMKHPHQTKGRFASVTTPKMIFPFSNGVPLLTERKLAFWRRPIAEIICFINGARTLADMERIGGKHWPAWWSAWLDAKTCDVFGYKMGDNGPGSYGPAFHDFQTPNGPINQIERLVEQIKRDPNNSTHKVSTWQPHLVLQDEIGKRQVVVAPCHGDLQVSILDNRLYLTMIQRSADTPIGVPSNMIQYAALALMLAQVTGYNAHTFVHVLVDAQIYEDQFKKVEEILEREPHPFPTLRITETGITNIFDFRPEHFELTDYYPHPAIGDIPVTK